MTLNGHGRRTCSQFIGIALCGTTCALAFANDAAFAAAHKRKPEKQSRRTEALLIQSMEQQWRNAVVGGDSSALEKLLSDDFLAISANGTLSDKRQYLQRIATHTIQLSSMDLMDLKIRVQQSSVVAVSQARVAGMLEGRPMNGVFRYTNIYSRDPAGTWRMTNFEATRMSKSAIDDDLSHGVPLADKPAAMNDH